MDMSNKLLLAGAAVLALAGCDDQAARDAELDRELNSAVESEATRESLSKLSSEDAEIREFLAKAQKDDPAIKDAYYSVDEATGQRQLNVVREQTAEDGTSTGDVVTYALLGAVAGGLLASALASPPASYREERRHDGGGGYYGGYHGGYASSLQSQATHYYPRTREEEKRRRAAAYGGYVSHVKSASVQGIRSNPSRLSTIRTGVLSRVTSARSASYRASSVSGGRSAGISAGS